MTIHYCVKTRKTKERGNKVSELYLRVPVYVRIKDGRRVDQMVRTRIMVNPFWWDPAREEISMRSSCPEEEILQTNSELGELRRKLITAYLTEKRKGVIHSDWLRRVMFLSEDEESSKGHLDETCERFCRERSIAPSRQAQYHVVFGILRRFETFIKKVYDKDYRLVLQDVDEKTLRHLYEYICTESQLAQQYPEIFKSMELSRIPRKRGKNTVIDIFKKLRAIFNWLQERGEIDQSPFQNFHIGHEIYGTPICLTKDEMSTILSTPMPTVALEQVRDVFIFQCNIGCRVSDLMRLMEDDVVEDAISYIPTKTINKSGRTVTVPLNGIAKSIIKKYRKRCGGHLLPFSGVQQYNIAIKKVLKTAGITQQVTILDAGTSSERRIPICDIASSHLARRTFINILYARVKDPALVASLTGHVEGSKAFSRYRDIDSKIKRELVEMLD